MLFVFRLFTAVSILNTKNVFWTFRYKLHLFVKYDSDSCTIMMLDSVAQSIIRNAATELWDGSYDEVLFSSVIT